MMILEIHYKGEIIKEVEFPGDVNSDHLQFRSRRESKMNKPKEKKEVPQPEVPAVAKKGTGKKPYFDVPRTKIPMKQKIVLEKVKAEYSNRNIFEEYKE